MSYKFGVSYNCEIVGVIDVGDGCCSTLDMVGNDLTKIIDYMTKGNEDPALVLVLDNDEYIGKEVSIGGKVVAYFAYVDSDITGYDIGEPIIVIFENPSTLQVIE